MISFSTEKKNNENEISQNDNSAHIKKIIKNNLTILIIHMIYCYICKINFFLNNVLHCYLKLKTYIKSILLIKIKLLMFKLSLFIKIMKSKIIMFLLKNT